MMAIRKSPCNLVGNCPNTPDELCRIWRRGAYSKWYLKRDHSSSGFEKKCCVSLCRQASSRWRRWKLCMHLNAKTTPAVAINTTKRSFPRYRLISSARAVILAACGAALLEFGVLPDCVMLLEFSILLDVCSRNLESYSLGQYAYENLSRIVVRCRVAAASATSVRMEVTVTRKSKTNSVLVTAAWKGTSFSV